MILYNKYEGSHVSKWLFLLILVKMAGDCGLNALSLLPENVLPQWQQKIAMQKIMQVDEVTKH